MNAIFPSSDWVGKTVIWVGSAHPCPCLEAAQILAVKTSLPALKGHHALVSLDNMVVVALINHQGGLKSYSLHRLAQQLFF